MSTCIFKYKIVSNLDVAIFGQLPAGFPSKLVYLRYLASDGNVYTIGSMETDNKHICPLPTIKVYFDPYKDYTIQPTNFWLESNGVRFELKWKMWTSY